MNIVAFCGVTRHTVTEKFEITYIIMRCFLGVGRSALIGDMGWLTIATITKLNCGRFWLRRSNMTDWRQTK